MKKRSLPTGRSRPPLRRAAGAMLLVAAAGAAGCLDRPIDVVEPRTTSTILERLTQSSVDKIDILLAIDNSRSMADKQEVLKLAVPDLVRGLVNPPCLDDAGVASAKQPTGPLDDCPEEGSRRDFEPVTDIHIGIISSSLGGFGAAGANAACKGTSFDTLGNHSENDRGHLLARESELTSAAISTYENKGFLAWDPTQSKRDPPGEQDTEKLITTLSQMVVGVGQYGCGLEAQLESWYRFLVDPEPYESLVIEDDKTKPVGVDKVIVGERDAAGNVVSLGQRAEFLRPDSLLAIIMLTDENDCSIRESGQGYVAAQLDPFRLWKPRAACATDPNSPCCRSCAQAPGTDADGKACPEELELCGPLTNPTRLTKVEDPVNLRCFDQKRRFGIDFLYDTQRYVKALQDPTVADRQGNLVPNPLFTDLNPDDGHSTVRAPGLIFFAGIVGVPWQDIARQDADGKPDLLHGLDAEGQPVGGLMSASELSSARIGGASTWDIILGDPKNQVKPLDPFMIETLDPRSGTNPVTGDSITSFPATNGINGNDFTQNADRDDLQYACIAPLLAARDCTTEDICDCTNDNDNPLCAANEGGQRTLQVNAKAYPGVRELQVLKGLGSQGIVGSVCPKQLTDHDAPDFGYRPAIGAIIERLKSVLGGQCLPRTLKADAEGQVQCLILEGRKVEPDRCGCDHAARRVVEGDAAAAEAAAKQDPIAVSQGLNCFCEIVQTLGDDLAACQNETSPPVKNASGASVNGWCYVDATTSPPTGDPAIVAKCPATEQRIIRFVGEGEGQPGATLYITCSGDSGG